MRELGLILRRVEANAPYRRGLHGRARWPQRAGWWNGDMRWPCGGLRPTHTQCKCLLVRMFLEQFLGAVKALFVFSGGTHFGYLLRGYDGGFVVKGISHEG